MKSHTVAVGASSGVGLVTARKFAARGDRLTLIARSEAGLLEAAASIDGAPRVLALDMKGWRSGCKSVRARHNRSRGPHCRYRRNEPPRSVGGTYRSPDRGELRQASRLSKFPSGRLACCRFSGHRVKVLKMEPEFSHGEKKVQPRVQA